MKVLLADEWQARQAAHVARLQPFVVERTTRMSRHEKHPVRDFLFTYYSHRPAVLLRWSPGPEVLLEDATPADVDWQSEFEPTPDGMILRREAFPTHRQSFIRWACNYLDGIAARPPQYGCFGLHEWAMVYREPNVRHASTPLRLSPEALAAFVESEHLCCTHYDAFRFFTPAAVPLNLHQLTRAETDQHDQPGCVHVTMDLYRYAYKITPWVEAELLADTFALANEARQLDMQASPYDLREFGLTPIPIETPAGKEEYVRRQRALYEASIPLRERLVAAYRDLMVESIDHLQRGRG